MRINIAVALLAVGTGLWAGEAGRAPGRIVVVCLSPGSSMVVLQGREVATRVLKQAGIRIEWRNDERSCAAARDGIVVELSNQAPKNLNPSALAYAMPFERTHVVLFYDRVLNSAPRAVVPYLFGYVLAHEIVHMVHASDWHSASGVMKARWDEDDYTRMKGFRLRFTKADLLLIDGSLARLSPPPNVE